MPRGNHDDHNERKRKAKQVADNFVKESGRRNTIFYNSLLRQNDVAAGTEQQAFFVFALFLFGAPLPRDE